MVLFRASLAALTLVLHVPSDRGIASAIRPESPDLPAAVAPLLLQSHAARTHGSTELAAAKTNKSSRPFPAGWFGDFSSGESTYTYDGLFNRDQNPTVNILDGWNPQAKQGVTLANPPQFFEETRSGGSTGAWQTYFPAVPENTAADSMPTGAFYQNAGGIFQQKYRSSPGANADGALPASWFDNAVNQLDAYGRKEMPPSGSFREDSAWQERSVNTTLTCKAPGCTATASLQAPFNAAEEKYKNCLLSVHFHPTDFDTQHSEENVEYVKVNGRVLSADCAPDADGCNQTASRPLLPCVRDVPIDSFMPSDGVLNIEAKIPEVVDECPYNGNLLSAVPMVTCLVAPQQGAPTPPAPKDCVVTAPLRCSTRGCTAVTDIPIHASCSEKGKCVMSVTVKQTDFDNSDGTEESIEYIKVGGKEVKSNLKPGENPCKTTWSGKELEASKLNFTALQDYDVTEEAIHNGSVLVEGKISPFVDECPSNGNLFDAVAKVICSDSGDEKATSLQQRAAVHRSKLRGHNERLAKMLRKIE